MEESTATSAAAPVAIFKKRGAKKANFRKRPATPPPADNDSDGSSAYSSSEDEAGQRIKRRRTNAGVVTASSKNHTVQDRDHSATVFTADRNAPLTNTNDATKQTNWYDDPSKADLSSKHLLGSTRAVPDGTYKGLAHQTSFTPINPSAAQRAVGPVKAPTNIRTVTVTDFAPDVCKDYKTTGFCGFGDNCKYLHAREDYKAGWQLDREWENVTKGKKNLGGTVVASASKGQAEEDDDADDEDEEEDALLESVPFVCIICREDYKSPIVTRCGHYFCEPCALKRYRRDPSCAACGSGTNGVFNSARRLQKLLERKRQRAAKKRQQAIEAGEEVSDEEEQE